MMASRKSDSFIGAADPAVNAVVAASAGTGKTWLLVARLLRLLLAGEKHDSILAITFTRKAAAEIKDRLYQRLRDWSLTDDDELNRQLAEIGIESPQQCTAKARVLYEKLLHSDSEMMILTFHAFCEQLLRQFPFEENLPNDFEIVEDPWEIQQQAYDRLLREAVTDAELGETLTRLIEACNYSFATTKRSLFDFLSQRNNWFAYNDWFVSADNEPLDAAQAADRLKKALLPPTKKLPPLDHTALKDFAAVLKAHGTDTFIEEAETIEQALEGAADVWDEALYAQLSKVFFTQGGSVKKKFENIPKTFLETMAANDYEPENLMDLVAAIEQARDFFYRSQNWQRNRDWYVVGQKLLEIYQDVKKTDRVVDFDDLEWYANKLLNHQRSADWVQARLRMRIDHVLVDEFQDTNPLQWQLLKPLLEEMASQEGNYSVFIVGDVKQSIYGFRRANPLLLREVGDWIRQNMRGGLYSLDKSRRSSPEIIRFVNKVCQENQSFKERFEDFVPHETVIKESGGCARLPMILPDDSTAKTATDEFQILPEEPIMSTSPATDEADCVALKICELIDGQTPIHTADGMRSATYGDVLILFRRNACIPVFETALRRQNIPYLSTTGTDLLQSMEVADLLALLRLLINPSDKLALIHALRSPIFSATNEHLLTLARVGGDASWLPCLRQQSEENQTDPFWKRTWRLLDGWTKDAERLPLHDLLDKIYAQGDLIRRYRLAAATADYRDLTEHTLLDFLDYALDFESGRYPSIDGLLDYAARRPKDADSAAKRGGTGFNGEDCVNLMTIHKSKGLEAPFVFLADAGSRRAPPDTYRPLVDWPAEDANPRAFLLIPPLKYRDDYTEKFIRIQKQRDEKEEANLLYVAITRARQYFFLSGHQAKGSKINPCLYRELQDFLDELPQPEQESMETKTSADETALLRPKADFEPPRFRLEESPSRLSSPFISNARGGDEDDWMRGLVIHKALELLNGTSVGADQVLTSLQGAFSEATEDDLKSWLDEALQVKQNTALAELFDDASYSAVFNELPLSFIDQGQQFYGVIDRLCVNAAMAWLVDYKTHKQSERRLDELKRHYQSQMQAYHAGVRRLYPQLKIRSSLLFTETNTLVDYDFSETAVAE